MRDERGKKRQKGEKGMEREHGGGEKSGKRDRKGQKRWIAGTRERQIETEMTEREKGKTN